jgi:propanediol dehydratase small subunit
MSQENTSSFTGRPLQDLTIDKVLSGKLTAEDFRTNAETLREQAKTAAAGGYRQLAENLQRAAELTCLSTRKCSIPIISCVRDAQITNHLSPWLNALKKNTRHR